MTRSRESMSLSKVHSPLNESVAAYIQACVGIVINRKSQGSRTTLVENNTHARKYEGREECERAKRHETSFIFPLIYRKTMPRESITPAVIRQSSGFFSFQQICLRPFPLFLLLTSTDTNFHFFLVNFSHRIIVVRRKFTRRIVNSRDLTAMNELSFL